MPRPVWSPQSHSACSCIRRSALRFLTRLGSARQEDDETKQREDDDGENQPIELVDAEDVIRALRTFVEEQQRQNPVALLEVCLSLPPQDGLFGGLVCLRCVWATVLDSTRS